MWNDLINTFCGFVLGIATYDLIVATQRRRHAKRIKEGSNGHD